MGWLLSIPTSFRLRTNLNSSGLSDKLCRKGRKNWDWHVYMNFSVHVLYRSIITWQDEILSTSIHTVRPLYHTCMIIFCKKPVINAGCLEQFYMYPTVHTRLERSLSSTFITPPPPHPRYGLNRKWQIKSDKLKENQNVEKKTREFNTLDIAYKYRTYKENNIISIALIWDEIKQQFNICSCKNTSTVLHHMLWNE